jgi:DNA-binding LacI/PurR family transcriptional regulator
MKKEKSIKKITAKEIAAITGFSTATISLALNNKGSISEETRKAVLDAAEELKYSRSSSLGNGNAFIRLLIEDSAKPVTTDPFNGEIIRAIEHESRLMGYEIILTFVRHDSDPAAWLVGASGLLVLGSGLITDQLLLHLKDAAIPVILVDNYTHEGMFSSIHADHYDAGYLATKHLIQQGHSKIGYISGPSRYKTLTDRFAGYCAALVEHGIPLKMEYISPNWDKKHEHKGYLEMKYLMELPDRPTAVFACSDKSALGAMKALSNMGFMAGADVDLIGCDNIEEVQNTTPTLSTVHMPKWQVGQQAVRSLVEAVNGNPFIGKIVVPGQLIMRDSVGTR